MSCTLSYVWLICPISMTNGDKSLILYENVWSLERFFIVFLHLVLMCSKMASSIKLPRLLALDFLSCCNCRYGQDRNHSLTTLRSSKQSSVTKHVDTKTICDVIINHIL